MSFHKHISSDRGFFFEKTMLTAVSLLIDSLVLACGPKTKTAAGVLSPAAAGVLEVTDWFYWTVTVMLAVVAVPKAVEPCGSTPLSVAVMVK